MTKVLMVLINHLVFLKDKIVGNRGNIIKLKGKWQVCWFIKSSYPLYMEKHKKVIQKQ